jgi:hypothetical protein
MGRAARNKDEAGAAVTPLLSMMLQRLSPRKQRFQGEGRGAQDNTREKRREVF